MDDAKRFEVRQVIAAPIDKVFAAVADPGKHVRIDGSGMLQATDSGPVAEAGQTFVMDMYRDSLGHYRTVNLVTEFEPGVRLSWAPSLDVSYPCPLVEKLANITTGGHTYTYQLREVAGGTEITQIYDWSGVKDPQFEAFCPFVSREELTETLAKLAREVEGAP